MNCSCNLDSSMQWAEEIFGIHHDSDCDFYTSNDEQTIFDEVQDTEKVNESEYIGMSLSDINDVLGKYLFGLVVIFIGAAILL